MFSELKKIFCIDKYISMAECWVALAMTLWPWPAGTWVLDTCYGILWLHFGHLSFMNAFSPCGGFWFLPRAISPENPGPSVPVPFADSIWRQAAGRSGGGGTSPQVLLFLWDTPLTTVSKASTTVGSFTRSSWDNSGEVCGEGHHPHLRSQAPPMPAVCNCFRRLWPQGDRI